MIDRVWVPDRQWTTEAAIIAGKRCRRKLGKHAMCQRPAAAALARRNGWWCYCDDPDHLYGRRINDGVVEVLVTAESPAAERGFMR